MTDEQSLAAQIEDNEARAALRSLRAIQQTAEAARQMDGAALIAFCKTIRGGQMTQADIARGSGLTPNTITALAHGKKPTAAQRAAIMWAIARALGI